MKSLSWLTVCFIFSMVFSSFGQGTDHNGWSEWMYTWKKTDHNAYYSGILYRSKCMPSSGANSKWEYQFKSKYSQPMDFVFRHEQEVDGSETNEVDQPEAFTIKGFEETPVFTTTLHGGCDKVDELKLEVLCVTEHDRDGEEDLPCFQGKDGDHIEFKPIP